MTRALALLILLAPACGWSAPSGTVVVHGPAAARVQIEAAVDVWASEGAAVVVGQIGPCDGANMAECRTQTPGEHWRVRVVANGTVEPGGATVCDPTALASGQPVVFGTTHYASRVITLGACALGHSQSDAIVTHELGHVLLGDHHSSEGVMVAHQPKTVNPSHETLLLACTVGWGC